MNRWVTPPKRVTSPTWVPHLHVNSPLEEFVQHQENKSSYHKQTKRDVSLLKKFLVSRNKPRQLESIDVRDLDVLIANFLYFKFERKTENNTSPHR